jgi:hypothetical protein
MNPRPGILIVALLSIADSGLAQVCAEPPAPALEFDDALDASRRLRRMALTLLGTTPTPAQYDEILTITDPTVQDARLDAIALEMLGSTKFYEQMVRFGHEWFGVGAYTTGGGGEGYQGDMQGHLFVCPAGSTFPGSLYHSGELGSASNACFGLDPSGNVATIAQLSVEPWWAPGTLVHVVGQAASGVSEVLDAYGDVHDCGLASGGYWDPGLAFGCGCGPNLVWCSPLRGLGAGSTHDLGVQRRHPYEEPARLLAHLVWYDRPLSDLVLGNYSVGTNWLRALYVRLGRQAGNKTLDANTSWWRPDEDSSPRDPLHPSPGDPQAWREFVVEELNPHSLALTPGRQRSGSLERHYAYDPRTTLEPALGIPSAGVLTMIGTNSSFSRERVRAARLLEAFACMSFSPPSADQVFPPYTRDPATGGTCMHCHMTLDPAAIAFKRWEFGGDSYYVPWPFMSGIGRFRVTADWLSGNYPYHDGPGFRMKTTFLPDTVMTPVTPEQVAHNPEALLLDTIPASYSLFGEPGNGTMGPLGFGKILVTSGEFDRCTVRRFYERIVGRALDPAIESAYIDRLAADFVAGGRQLRPFLLHLMAQPEFRRGL